MKPKTVEEWFREWIFNTYLRIYAWGQKLDIK